MTAPFLALITPLAGSGNYPDQGLPQPQPPRPGGSPPGIWGPTDPRPGTGLPGNQPYPDQGLPQPPLGIWGGGGVGNYPDQGLPGQQPRPDQGLPGQPPYPSQGPGFPTHPITLPPDLPEELPDPDNRPIDWKTAWTPQTGWIIVGVPTGPVPTPSA